MSTDKDKLKGKKGRKLSNTCATSLGKNEQRSKCKNISRPSDDNGITKSKQLTQKMQHNKSIGRPKNRSTNELRLRGPSGDDGIAKSKQLTQKKQTNRSIGRPKTRTIMTNNNNEPRLCGNGIPMPSLSELEKLFEDSDGEEEPTVNNVDKTIPNNSDLVPTCDESPSLSDLDEMYNDANWITLNNTIPNLPDGCSTPKKNITISENNLNSPTTIKTIANKMLDFISNLQNPTALNDNARPAVVPPKKRKKPEQPYIVGCKDRTKVESRPKTSFCKGDADYGVDSNSDEEDEYPKKRAKRTKTANISKSIFNAKSDEIAARLKECQGDLSNGSSDSNKTVAYVHYTPPSSGRSQSFSPLPSTSRDSETIHENDIRFNQSLVLEQPPNENIDNSVEVINNPPITIIIDDEVVSTTTAVTNLPVIEIDDNPEQVHSINNTLNDNRPNNIDDDSCIEIIECNNNNTVNDNRPNNIDDDSCIEIIECNNNSIATRVDSPIQVVDYYSSLDLTQPSSGHCDEDVTEVIDVDDVLAENNAIINKYRNSNDFDTVTSVEPSANNIVSVIPHMTQIIDTSVEPRAPHRIDTISEDREEEGSTTKCVLRQYTLSVDSETDMQIDYLYAPGQPTSPVLHISNLPTQPRDVYGRDISIEDRVRNFFNNNVDKSDNHQSVPTNVVLRSSSNEAELRDRLQKTCPLHQPQPNFFPSTPVITELLPPKGLGDCPICMDRLNRQPVASTVCGHIFCLECIKQAIKTSGKKCPTCRKTLKGIGFHQLFL